MLAPSLGVGRRGQKSDQRDARVLSETSCRVGVTTLYCEGEGSHAEWPGRNTALLEFFASAPLKAR